MRDRFAHNWTSTLSGTGPSLLKYQLIINIQSPLQLPTPHFISMICASITAHSSPYLYTPLMHTVPFITKITDQIGLTQIISLLVPLPSPLLLLVSVSVWGTIAVYIQCIYNIALMDNTKKQILPKSMLIQLVSLNTNIGKTPTHV